MLGFFSENQIYRIDHYLGKETVQNIMVLRFANGMFEPIWCRDHVDHVQITVAETVSVENRGKLYDRTGALRDMVPNHLFQLLALTAMEPPNCFEADAVRTEKLKAIDAIHPLTSDRVLADVVRGQYAAGSRAGKAIPAYRDAAGVAPQSTTETYVAMRLMIDNWRWAGVPFYLRTGKALGARKTEIAIKFKSAPLALFRDMPVESLAQNLLVLRIQPDEGAALHFNAKIPGPEYPHRKCAHEFQIRRLLRRRAEHRLRNADLRLHDRRSDAVPARRRHRSGLARGAAHPRRLAGGGRKRSVHLPGGKQRTESGGAIAVAQRT